MARPFRFYVKKRGTRSTTSQALGSAALAIFFAALFFAGVGLLSRILVTLIIPEWRSNHQFREATGLVLKRHISQHPDGSENYRPEILIRYELPGGTAYETWAYDVTRVYSSGRSDKQAIVDQFGVGRRYPCWYDPLNPQTVVLVRGYTWYPWLISLFPLSFITVGGGGLVYSIFAWGKSAERRAALTARATQLELFESATPSAKEYPSIPGDANITNSPGTTLAYRLPVSSSSTWVLATAMVVALVVNAAAAVFAVMAVRSHLRGEPDWVLTLFVVPWLAIGVAAVMYFLRQLVLASTIGPTTVEISDHPFRPGQQYDAFLSQSGRLTMKSLNLLLVCEEKATFQQGTNTRTEVRRVLEEPLVERHDFAIKAGAPLEVRLSLSVPQGAMHSFKSGHNEVNWRLLVRGDVADWTDYERSFPLVVHPPRDGSDGP